MSSPDYRVKYASGATLEVEPGSASVIPGWASVPIPDRSKEYLDGRDMDLGEFNLNPVFLWCHKRDVPPLGRVNGLAPREWGGTGDFGLFGRYEFAPDDEFAQRVYKLYRGGFLKSFSVGFSPVGGWRQMSPDELSRRGFDSGQRVMRMVSGKLIEMSSVPVGDNQLALAAPVVKSLLSGLPESTLAEIYALTPPQSTFAADYAKVRPGFPPAEKQIGRASCRERV